MKVKRSEGRTRLCDLCCTAVVETDFPDLKSWVCQTCVQLGRECVMPLVKVGDHYHRYDTRAVFEGWRVFKVTQGDSRAEYETEVRSPQGEFYAAGGATVAFFTKTARAATMLLKRFPELREFVSGDDGRAVLLIPAELFPMVAKHVKAYRGRKSEKPRTEAQVAAIEKARAARAAVVQPSLL